MENVYGNNTPSIGSMSSTLGNDTDVMDTDIPDGPGPEIMAASTLEGDIVVNWQDERLGDIKEIMIDVRGGHVAYAVLSTGGLLGIGEKLHAIPWSALQLDTDRECFVLDIDAERLRSSPGFDKDHWPSMADSKWAAEVNDYYRQPDNSRPGQF